MSADSGINQYSKNEIPVEFHNNYYLPRKTLSIRNFECEILNYNNSCQQVIIITRLSRTWTRYREVHPRVGRYLYLLHNIINYNIIFVMMDERKLLRGSYRFKTEMVIRYIMS